MKHDRDYRPPTYVFYVCPECEMEWECTARERKEMMADSDAAGLWTCRCGRDCCGECWSANCEECGDRVCGECAVRAEDGDVEWFCGECVEEERDRREGEGE